MTFAQAPTTRLRVPLAALLSSADDGVMIYRYADAVRLTGYSCLAVAGAHLTARAALNALYPDSLPKCSNIVVTIPSPEGEGSTGVVAQVLTLIASRLKRFRCDSLQAAGYGPKRQRDLSPPPRAGRVWYGME